MDAQIQVVKRDTIPPIHQVESGGTVHHLGELRDFRWSDELRHFMPDTSVVSISWAKLGHREVLETHEHPIQTMMVFYAGSGEMIGDLHCPLRAGDVVIVPPGCKHGFIGGPESLWALSIQFGEGLYTKPDKPRVVFAGAHSKGAVESLKAYNRQRIDDFTRRGIFDLLTDGTLENPVKREAYFRYLQIWVDGNQKLLFSRQASCVNPKYEAMFLTHMREEMGHDLLHTERSAEDHSPSAEATHSETKARDAVLEAITNWFAYQMFVLDDAEKTAVIHLVIENASELYHRRAMPVLGKYIKNDYFELHVGADGDHAAMGMALLEDESPRTCARLKDIVAEAWDMMGAMTDRLVELTRSA